MCHLQHEPKHSHSTGPAKHASRLHLRQHPSTSHSFVVSSHQLPLPWAISFSQTKYFISIDDKFIEHLCFLCRHIHDSLRWSWMALLKATWWEVVEGVKDNNQSTQPKQTWKVNLSQKWWSPSNVNTPNRFRWQLCVSVKAHLACCWLVQEHSYNMSFANLLSMWTDTPDIKVEWDESLSCAPIAKQKVIHSTEDLLYILLVEWKEWASFSVCFFSNKEICFLNVSFHKSFWPFTSTFLCVICSKKKGKFTQRRALSLEPVPVSSFQILARWNQTPFWKLHYKSPSFIPFFFSLSLPTELVKSVQLSCFAEEDQPVFCGRQTLLQISVSAWWGFMGECWSKGLCQIKDRRQE